MAAKVCPCNGCVAHKRHLGCHSTCPDHKEWKDEQEQIRQNRLKILDEESFYNCVTSKRFLRK